MTDAANRLRSGKGHRDENFPVASWLIAPRHRGAILAFYNFVRTADDIADHPQLSPDDKLAHLNAMEADLDGKGDRNPEAVALRDVIDAKGLSSRHAKDLLVAFRLDVTKLRYPNWDELIEYCSFSAMPVGRYVLDVHGESRATWAANDALCAALQIINHLQDCQKDFRELNRVYIPLDALAAHGLTVEALNDAQASPALQQCLRALAEKTERLLATSDVFPDLIRDARLSLEVAVILRLAHRLTHLLMDRDPLSERVHLGGASVAALTAAAVLTRLMRSSRTKAAAQRQMVP